MIFIRIWFIVFTLIDYLFKVSSCMKLQKLELDINNNKSIFIFVYYLKINKLTHVVFEEKKLIF